MVGEFLILIAIVILGGAFIKILADMRSNADRQIKVAGVCAISANLKTGLMNGGADPRRSARAMGW